MYDVTSFGPTQAMLYEELKKSITNEELKRNITNTENIEERKFSIVLTKKYSHRIVRKTLNILGYQAASKKFTTELYICKKQKKLKSDHF